MDFYNHETALIGKGAIIGAGTKIWHWVHVCAGAKTGENGVLGQNVYIGNNVIIGSKVKIQNNVSVYDNVTLEDGVFCGLSMVFTNVVNPRAEIERKHEFISTLVKRGATFGANCTIVYGNSIGQYALIGAGAVVTKDVPDFALMVVMPAQHIGWVSRLGEKLELPLTGDAQTLCDKSGDKYVLKGDVYTVLAG